MNILLPKKNGNKKKGKGKKKIEAKPKTWNLEDSTNHSCPHANITVNIPLSLYNEIMKVYLHGLRNGIEITIYAKVVENCITEMYVPVQENGRSSVGLQEVVPLSWNCIIHSHPDGIKEFSWQDWQTLMVNRDCCLLINNGSFTDGKFRLKMPCDCMMYSDVTVVIPDTGLEGRIKKTVAVEESGEFFYDAAAVEEWTADWYKSHNEEV